MKYFNVLILVSSNPQTFTMSKGDSFVIPKDLFKGGDDLFVGLGWEAPGGVDLDASIIIFDSNHKKLDVVYFGNKTYGNAIKHRGDNMTGVGKGDDERIDIDLDQLSPDVQEMYVTVNIYSPGRTFAQVKDAYVRLCAIKNQHELCRYTLRDAVKTNGLVFACIKRAGGGAWSVSALGKEAQGRRSTDDSMLEALHPSARRAPRPNNMSSTSTSNNEPDSCCIVS